MSAVAPIEPLGRDADYFAVFGLPRRLRIEPEALEREYHSLSRRFHPDMYRLASSRERMIALENSALVNQAYRTLRDPFERAAYLLKVEGVDSGESKAAPQELFDAILEVQELLADFQLGDQDEKRALRPRLAGKQDELQAEQDRRAETLTGRLFREWDARDGRSEPERAALLEAIRRIISERSYLRRVLSGLSEALNAAPA